jgi:hypothetical protein
MLIMTYFVIYRVSLIMITMYIDNLPTPHALPVHPCGHIHWNDPLVFRHVPPFIQTGLACKHSLTSDKQQITIHSLLSAVE